MSNVEVNVEEPTDNISSSTGSASPYPDVYHTIEVGYVIFNSKGEIVDSYGDLKDDENLTTPLIEIVKTLRLHSLMKLTKDSFKGLTLQFSDHYYKIDMSMDNSSVYKYLLKVSSVNA